MRPDWKETGKAERVRIVLEGVAAKETSLIISERFTNCTAKHIRAFASATMIALPARAPAPEGFAKKPSTASSASVRRFFTIVDQTKARHGAIAKYADIHTDTLSQWKHDVSSPRLRDFENAARAIGYRLELVPITEAAE